MYVTPDGLAVSLSNDLLETPRINLPILQYIQLKPMVYYSVNKLFSGKDDEKGNGFGIAAKEDWGFGLQIVKIQF
jgi:hypothetical protein